MTILIKDEDQALIPRLWVVMVRAVIHGYHNRFLPKHLPHLQRALDSFAKHQSKLVNPNFDMNRGRQWYAHLRQQLDSIPDGQWLPAMLWAAVASWEECSQKRDASYAWARIAQAVTPMAQALENEYNERHVIGADHTIINLPMMQAATMIAESANAAVNRIWYGQGMVIVPRGATKAPQEAPFDPILAPAQAPPRKP